MYCRREVSMDIKFFCLFVHIVLFCFVFILFIWNEESSVGKDKYNLLTPGSVGGVYRQSHTGTQALLVAVLLSKPLWSFVWATWFPKWIQKPAAGLHVKLTWICRTTLSQKGSQEKFWRWWCKVIPQIMASSLITPAPLAAEHSEALNTNLWLLLSLGQYFQKWSSAKNRPPNGVNCTNILC